jgi:hypothetical protein
MADHKFISIRGAREHNLKNIDRQPAPRQPDRDDGPVRLGQILARLRHDLRRRPAPLCRVALRLCAPVPRDDAEAGCRADRGPVAGHFHRAEDHVAQPALDGRHRHGNLRLSCACSVRARRHSLFAGHRAAHREPDGLPDGRPRAGASQEGTRLYHAGPHRARPQGRVQEGDWLELQKKGFQRVKVDGEYLRDRGSPSPRQEVTSTISRWSSTASWSPRTISARGWPKASRPRCGLPTASVSNSPTAARWHPDAATSPSTSRPTRRMSA